MNAINERLLELERRGTPVVIGLVGAGQMGQEILCQAQLMRGLTLPIVVDVSFERAQLAYDMARVDRARVVCSNDLEEIATAVRQHQFVAATSRPAAMAWRAVFRSWARTIRDGSTLAIW